MKTLIINPPAVAGIPFVREGRCEQRLSSYQYVLLPISLPSIAAVLRQNEIEVKIIDAIAEDLSWSDLRKQIRAYSSELIILNVSTVSFDGDMQIAQKIKKLKPNTHISAIGVHTTALPEEALRYAIDSVIRGEPEITALKLAQTLAHKKSLRHVLGLSYKDQERNIHHNPERPFIENLDSLPFPARDLLPNQKYLMSMSDQPHTILLSSRGCNQSCIFCTARQYYGRKLRLRSAQNIVAEMLEVQNKYKIHYITMWSDTFTLDKQFVLDLCREIVKQKIKLSWMCNSRVDTVDQKMLQKMKEAGCIGIAFGVESGVQKILDRAGKKTSLAQIEKVFALMKKVGIESLAHFVLGLPGETKKSIKQTIRFAKKLDPDYVQFYCAIPFPGTPLYHLAKKKGWLVTQKWSDFEINRAILETPLLSRKELENMRKRAYLSFYLRPRYLLKNLRKVKSFKEFRFKFVHAAKFVKDWAITAPPLDRKESQS